MKIKLQNSSGDMAKPIAVCLTLPQLAVKIGAGSATMTISKLPMVNIRGFFGKLATVKPLDAIKLEH